jgi:predicted TIM-barrel fold metal-dependent hydrolase
VRVTGRSGAGHAGTAIVDAHAHLLNPGELSYRWINQRSAALTFLLANYYDIARDFGPREYQDAVAGTGITTTIACEFGAVDPFAEARWVQHCHDTTSTPEAFIAAVDLGSSQLPDLLARYADLPLVRAVRQPLYWTENPLTRLGARPDYLTDPQWLREFERVADHGLVWDLLLYAEQLPDAGRLLDMFPDVPIVLEAAGWPLDRSPDGFRRWHDRILAVSEHRNVTLKLQGLALIFGPNRESVTPWLETALEVFGPDRCMFATHLPVDGLLWTCHQLLDATRGALTDLDPASQHALLAGTANRVYLSAQR